jgi:hypothetical protein
MFLPLVQDDRILFLASRDLLGLFNHVCYLVSCSHTTSPTSADQMLTLWTIVRHEHFPHSKDQPCGRLLRSHSSCWKETFHAYPVRLQTQCFCKLSNGLFPTLAREQEILAVMATKLHHVQRNSPSKRSTLDDKKPHRCYTSTTQKEKGYCTKN